MKHPKFFKQKLIILLVFAFLMNTNLFSQNTNPTFTSTPVTTVKQGDTYTYTITTNDIDNDNVAIIAPTLPSWLSLAPGGTTVNSLAGSTKGYNDATGTAAQFNRPHGTAVDAAGNVYVADRDNNRIRKVSPTGEVTTLAGSTRGFADGIGTAAKFNNPTGVAVDVSGNVYVADLGNERIRKISPTGEVSTFAGGSRGFADGTGALARFSNPYGVAVDAGGTVYVADQINYKIRKISSGGVVTTLAGSTQGFADGTGTAAKFNTLTDVAVDASGNVYVADLFNNRIRKVSPTGVVSTLAGSTFGFMDGTGTAAQFGAPSGVAVDASGNVYVADRNNSRIRKISPTGVVSTLAGSGTASFADGTGNVAQFNHPFGIAVDAVGTVYVGDGNNHKIRKIAIFYKLTGTPTSVEIGTHSVVLPASDGKGGTASQAFTVTVVADVTAPTITSTSPSDDATEVALESNIVLTFSEDILAGTGNITIHDANDDSVVETIAVGSANVSITGKVATINPTNDLGYNKSYYVEIAATAFKDVANNNFSGISNKTTLNFAAKTNAAPAFISTAVTTVEEDETYSYDVTTADSDGDLVAVSATTLPAWLSLTTVSAVSTLVGTPTSAEVGDHNVVLQASDGKGGTASQSFIVTVTADVTAPTIVSTSPSDDATGVALESNIVLTFSEDILAGTGNVTIHDANDDSVLETIVVGSANVSITDKVATINPTSNLAYNKNYYVQIAETAFKDVANNNFAGILNKTTLSFAVETNATPTFTSPPVTTVNEGQAYTYIITTADADDDDVSTTAPTIPSWLNLTRETIASTIAGSFGSFADGTGTDAQFNRPNGVAIDAAGNLYVADSSNDRIRKITPAGVVSTFAGSSRGSANGLGTAAQFNYPTGIAIDATGNLYVADISNERIRKITPAGLVSTFAGSTRGFADGAGVAAQFNGPSGVAIGTDGNIYVIDKFNDRVRMITPSGVVSTIAGSTRGFADGTGTAAQFDRPHSIAIDATGNMYVADEYNHKIRKVTPTGEVTTFAGSTAGFTDDTGTAARLKRPKGVALDVNGNVYVADTFNHRIRKITPTGVVTTFAGADYGFADGIGAVIQMNTPVGLAVDDSGDVFVVDYNNSRIRKLVSKSVLSGATTGNVGDHPVSLKVTDTGGLFSNQDFTITVIDVIAPTLSNTTPLDDATNVALDTNLELVFSEDIKAGTGNILLKNESDESTVATISITDVSQISISGNTLMIDLTDDLVANTYYYIEVEATAIQDLADNSYMGISNATTFNFNTFPPTAPAFTSSPIITIEEGTPYSYTVEAIDANRDNITTSSSTVPSWLNLSNEPNVSTLAGSDTEGFADGTGTSAQFNYPTEVAVDATGNTYVADHYNHRIRKITPEGVVTTFAGSGTDGFADGTGTAAQFYYPMGIALDGSGNLYVGDHYNHRIRKITPAGVVTTFAGSGEESFADGTGTTAEFNYPAGVTVDDSGNVYVADHYNHRIRKITPAGVVSTLAGSGAEGFADGASTAAQFNYPTGVAVDDSGNVYVADHYNHRIRKITATGVVSTLAGSGTDGNAEGTGTDAEFEYPTGVAVDGAGNVYVADYENTKIRQITPTGVVTTLAGTDESGNTDGTVAEARFYYPWGITFAPDGNLYVAGYYGQNIRKIELGAILSGSTTGQEGTHNVSLRVTDSGGLFSDQNFIINVVNPANIPPLMTESTPVDDSDRFGGTVITFTFDKAIVKGAGRISILDASDDTEIVGAGVGSARVTISGNTATFTLPIALPLGKDVYVRMPQGTFKDANDNKFAGILDKTTLNFSTQTVPVLVSTNPVDDSENFSGSSLSFTFDRNMIKGTGRISVFDASDDTEITGAGVGSSRVTITNNVITLDLINVLPENKQVYLRIPPSAFKDANDHFFLGITDKTSLNFATPTTPQLVSSSPVDDAVDVGATTLIFTFDRNIFKGTGRISVFDASDDSEITGAGIGSPRVTITNNVVTFDLVNSLPLDKQFYVRIPASAFKDANDLFFQGILDNTTLNFASLTAPKLLSSNPADEATGFTGTSLVLTFDRNMIKGTGRISIRDAADDTELTGAGVGSSRVVINDDVVTIDLINPLPLDKQMYVIIPASAFKDGNDLFYNGIQDQTTLNFASQTSPRLVSSNPADEAVGFAGTSLVLTFDRNMIKGTGRISIRDAADDTELTGAGVGSSRVVINDDVVTIDLINPLPLDKQVYITIPASAFKDGNDLFYNGIQDQTTLNFASQTSPQLVSSTPQDDGTDFTASIITLTFDRNVIKGTGRISIRDVADDSEIAGAGVGSTRVTVTGNVVAIDLVNPLPAGTNAYVKVPASAFKDASNRFYKGILDNTTLNFSTATPAEANMQNLDLELATIAYQSLSVYPNPAINEINIDLSKMGEEPTVRILSINGVVKLTEQAVKTPLLKVDISHYAEGIYIVTSQNKAGQVVYKKFMVSK